MSKKEDKNNQIIAAATKEFLVKGIDAASMHNIAEMAEVSKRTLYKYYSSKEELYSALIDEILVSIEDMYSFSYESEINPQSQIEKVVDAKINQILNDSFIQINKIVIGELLKGRTPNAEQMARLNKSESTFVEWIEHGQKEGKIKKEIEAHLIAQQFHSILKGQIYWPVLMCLTAKEDIDLEKVRKITIDFFINSFCL